MVEGVGRVQAGGGYGELKRDTQPSVVRPWGFPGRRDSRVDGTRPAGSGHLLGVEGDKDFLT